VFKRRKEVNGSKKDGMEHAKKGTGRKGVRHDPALVAREKMGWYSRDRQHGQTVVNL